MRPTEQRFRGGVMLILALGVALVVTLGGNASATSHAPATLKTADTATANAAQSGTIDLLTRTTLRIDGAAAGDTLGQVANAGDVNGDGRADVLIGAQKAGNNGRQLSGSAYVVFGRASTTTIDLAALGSAGFRIDGAAAADFTGQAVSSVGDVNGDGRADVIVGAPSADSKGRNLSGSAYVVFGKTTAATVDLESLGNSGFRIDGAAAEAATGGSVAGAGDVNGDGRPDLIVAADEMTNNGRQDAGSAYVVFGKASTTGVDLAALGAGGFRIDGAATFDGAGSSVVGVGDLNGDGRADVAVGAYAADNNARSNSGSVYVVFGKASRTAVDLAAIGARGFRIDGAASDDVTSQVAGAGDVNGDGRPDVLVGAFGADRNDRDHSGSAYVVFGKASTATVDLATLGNAGFHIGGAAARDSVAAVAGVGDVNRDGRPDIMVGAPGADANGRTDSGSAYVIFGKASPANIDLAALGASDTRIDGAAARDSAADVAGGGDVNGDGRPDVLVGARGADANGRADSGSVFVVFRADDATPPRLSVSADTPQPVSTRGDVRIRPACNERCTVRATGSIAFALSPIRFRLAPAQATLPSPRTTLALQLTNADRDRLTRSLAKGLRAQATVRTTATDTAGNTTTTQTVTIITVR